MQTTAQTLPSEQRPQTAAPKQSAPAQPKPVPPPEFRAGNIEKMTEPQLIEILKNPGSAQFQKAKACQRLAVVGTRDAVPALAALLTDAQLAHYARYGLEPIPDASADDALRAALPKVKGNQLVGILNSIGHRKDAKAVDPLSRLLSNSDVEISRAAAASLGKISGPAAAKVLQDGLGRMKGSVRSAVAGACLVCAEGLLAQGERDRGLALYNALIATDIPKPVRLAAMHGIIATETALNRPR